MPRDAGAASGLRSVCRPMLLVGACLVLGPRPAIGQAVAEPPASPDGPAAQTLRDDRWSIALGIPDGGGSELGLWRMVGARTNLGLQAGYRWTDDEHEGNDRDQERIDWSISLSPTLQRYLRVRGSVSPFVLVRAEFSVSRSEIGSVSPAGGSYHQRTSRAIGARVGLGAEWIPLPDVGIGGHTGLRFSHAWTDEETTGSDGLLEFEGTNSRAATFVSALTLRIFF